MEISLEIYGKNKFSNAVIFKAGHGKLNWNGIGKTTTRNGREEHHIANEEFKKRESDKE